MTTGEIIFYAGAALLVLTIILAVVFAVKKPQYKPENAAYIGADAGSTQRLRNGYPTDRLTVRAETKSELVSQTALLDERTEILPQTDVLPQTALLEEPTPDGTVPLSEETAPLADGTVPLANV